VAELWSQPSVVSGEGFKGWSVVRSRQTDMAFYVDDQGGDGSTRDAPQRHDCDGVWKLGFGELLQKNCTQTHLFIGVFLGGGEITCVLRIVSLTDLMSIKIDFTWIEFSL
jgi:hypothetical protein